MRFFADSDIPGLQPLGNNPSGCSTWERAKTQLQEDNNMVDAHHKQRFRVGRSWVTLLACWGWVCLRLCCVASLWAEGWWMSWSMKGTRSSASLHKQ